MLAAHKTPISLLESFLLFLLFNSILEDILPSSQLVTFLVLCCSKENNIITRIAFMSRWQRHGKTIQWLMRSHVSTLNVSWPVLPICWLCYITAGFYGKRISQLCDINDNGAANEREKIRQPTCLSANLRLTKTLAPLARNYKIRLSCSSPTPTRQFLIIFCGQIVPTWANIASVVSGGFYC